ncbi:MAG: hypothetical protein E6J82_05495 [Deltaproteobacteria bacterium]|nr:MAG: hypothetical protein E6J82_05495 [Deltaproteobacteria bacterium]
MGGRGRSANRLRRPGRRTATARGWRRPARERRQRATTPPFPFRARPAPRTAGRGLRAGTRRFAGRTKTAPSRC